MQIYRQTRRRCSASLGQFGRDGSARQATQIETHELLPGDDEKSLFVLTLLFRSRIIIVSSALLIMILLLILSSANSYYLHMGLCKQIYFRYSNRN